MDLIARVPKAFLRRAGGHKGGMELVDARCLEDLVGELPVPPVFAPGGSVGNTVFALAHLGVASRMLGMVGDDADGAFYRDELQAAGGDAASLRIHPSLPTARCLSMVTADGERTMRTHLGAAAALAPAHITEGDMAGCTHAHLEGYLLFNPALMEQTLITARQAGCRISMDLASFEVVAAAREWLPQLLEDHVDMVFANADEAAAFTGTDNPEVGLTALAECCETAAVKLGAHGALLKSGAAACHVPAHPADTVIDTTGAGDLWAAGFLHGWLGGCDLADCGARGAILGAEAVGQRGASLPSSAWAPIRSALAA